MLLSILIPTYNGGKFLKANLDVLLPQVVNYSEYVDLHIFDNDSDEETQHVLSGFKNKYGELLNIHKHTQNIGGVENIDYAGNFSKSTYSFLLGDDDILSPAFLDSILPFLWSSKEYSLLFWNRLSGDGNCNNGKVYDSKYVSTVIEYTPKEFICEKLCQPNFMSSILFNTQCWKKGDNLVDYDLGGYRWFSRILLGCIELDKPCLYYYFPLVIQRNPPRPWQKMWPHYGICELGRVFTQLEVYIPGILYSWKNKYQNTFSLMLSYVTLDQHYYRKEVSEIKKYLTPSQYILCMIMLYTPFPKVTKTCFDIFYSMKSKLFR